MLMLSRTERRSIVASAIQADPARSDRHIAKLTGASREMIRSVRARLVREGVVAARQRVIGGDGRNYPASPRGSRPAPTELARQTQRLIGLARQIDGPAWRDADDLTRRTFRLACERLATAARRLDEGRERGAG